jgi:hypothetical protein
MKTTTILLISQSQKMLATLTTILNTKLIIFLSVIVTFFAPVIPLIITTFCFILMDTAMGLFKAKYIGEKRNSNGFKRGFIPKVIVYSLLLFIVFMADKLITSDAVKHYTQFDYVITKILALVLIFIESWSIDENFKAIFKVSLIDKFQAFLKYIKSLFRKFLDNENR